MKPTARQIKVSQLRPDPRNANRGTERGTALLESSLREYGAGRSVLVDKNMNLIAGNKTVEQAAAIGLDDCIVVETDGSKLVVVQRTDLDLENDQMAKELAIADNRASQISLDWNPEILAELSSEIDLTKFWTDEEFKRLFTPGQQQTEGEDESDELTGAYQILVTCKSERQQTQLLKRFTEEGLECRALIS